MRQANLPKKCLDIFRRREQYLRERVKRKDKNIDDSSYDKAEASALGWAIENLKYLEIDTLKTEFAMLKQTSEPVAVVGRAVPFYAGSPFHESSPVPPRPEVLMLKSLPIGTKLYLSAERPIMSMDNKTKPKTIWIVLNFNRPFCTGFTRRTAICEAEKLCGKKWKDMKPYMRVAKFEVREILKS